MKREDLIKFNPTRELWLVAGTLLWLWFAYYSSEKLFADSIIYSLIVSIVLTMFVSCVGLPVWWVAVHKGEGLKGLGITTRRLGLSLLLSVVLAAWRGLELREYFGSGNFLYTLLFNGLAIWEVVFIFGFMLTRYEKAFGKVGAIFLTMASVGIYHIGTLTAENILALCFVIGVLALCFIITKNIFTLWPVYWAVGCSTSTLRNGMVFPKEMVVLSGIVLVLQLIMIAAIVRPFYHKVSSH